MMVRAIEQADIPLAAAIRARGWKTEAFWIDRIGRYLKGEHNPQQALEPRAMFVAVYEDHLAGFVAGHRTRRFGCDGELQWIDVIEERRGLGIATKLIAQMGTWFVEQGAYRICVNVASENVIARTLYMKCGAQSLKEGWMVWEDAREMCVSTESI
jgi:GNAT superfamily N-acetyltransferase